MRPALLQESVHTLLTFQRFTMNGNPKTIPVPIKGDIKICISGMRRPIKMQRSTVYASSCLAYLADDSVFESLLDGIIYPGNVGHNELLILQPCVRTPSSNPLDRRF